MSKSRTTIVPDVQYIKTSERGKLVNRLKYLQYREGSTRRREYLRSRRWEEADTTDTVLRRDDPYWVDRGMGEHFGAILKQCDEQQGSRVLAWTYVFAPDPEIMKHVDEDDRLDLVARVTDEAVPEFCERMEWGNQPYSYVVHNLKTDEGDPRPHSHVVLPGTHEDELERADCLIYERHIEQLHDITKDTFHRELARTIGIERTAELLQQRGQILPKDLHDELHEPPPEWATADIGYTSIFDEYEQPGDVDIVQEEPTRYTGPDFDL